MFTTISRAATVAPIQKPVKSPKDRGPVFAVIELQVQGDFKPANSDTVPSEGLSGMPADLVCRFAAMYNAHHHARQNRRWACVGVSGQMFFLYGVEMIDRPEDPAAYPREATTGLTYEEAIALQVKANDERLKVARVPRQWTIALRPLTPEGMLNP